MRYPLWKPILILLVIAGCAAMIAIKGLKPGIDLAGGTTLVYDVLIPKGADAEKVLNETIAIQSRRVDPTGTKNLVWRPEAGNRISVTMAQAGPVVKERSDAFDAARLKVLAGAIDPVRLDSALALDDTAEREKAFRALIGDDAARLAVMEELAVLGQKRDALYDQYEQANEAFTAAAPADPAAPSDEEKARLDAARSQLDKVAVEFLDARDAYAAKRAEVLANAVSPAEIDRVLALSGEVKKGQQASPRDEAFASLKTRYPQQADAIAALAAAQKAYDEVRGPLDDPNDLIRLLRGAGVLEFRIAATPPGSPQPAQPIDVNTYVQRLAEKGPRAGLTEDWRWFKVQDLDQFIDRQADRDALRENPDSAADVFAQMRLVGREYGGDFYILLANTPGNRMTGEEDWELTSVVRQSDELGRPSVGFSLDGKGAMLMGELTGNNVGRQMAIVLDGQLMSAPTLQSRLSSGGTITGEFSTAELNYLIQTLGAGSLEGQLSHDPISIKSTGPALGQDNLRRGMEAAILSLIVTALFIAGYYFFAGLVADFVLFINLVLILGVMSLLEATFTMPGIAGLVLTIGMAVDANVLIYERIREELENKADLATAVRLGFSKALSSIIDSNATTMISCVVLGYTASAEVKGFAVVLGIGLVTTMFTAVFCSRVIFDLYILWFKPKTTAMLPTVVPAVRRLLSPTVDWVKLSRVFIPLSIIVSVVGMTVVFYRGGDLLDIEFRSGTEVTFNLAEGKSLSIDEVRDRLENFGGTDAARRINAEVAASIERLSAQQAVADEALSADIVLPQPADWDLLDDAQVVTVGESTADGKATGFSVATLIENSQALSAAIREAFREELDVTESLSFEGADLDIAQAKGVVEPITAGNLYANLPRTYTAPDPDVQAFVGGVVIRVDELTPAASVEDLTERVSRMRRQTEYVDLGSRPFEVFGLERAGSNNRGEATYSAAAIVVKDAETNYAEDRSDFTDPAGLAATEWALVKDALQRDTSLASVSNFSSQVSDTMKQQAIVALTLSMLAIVIYIWFRFGSLRYGLAAIAALVHDVTVTLGLLALSGYLVGIPFLSDALMLEDFKINLTLVAAILTIVGYSLNDTIVVFDRVRENRGRLSYATPGIINDAVNQTVSRTVLTGSTTLMAVVILYVLGGPAVHGFAFAMFIGILTGTYSSIAIAAPILLIGEKKRHQAAVAATPAVQP